MISGTSFYADWSFWSFSASAIAIVLSQLPPIRLWLRRGKLTVEPYQYFHITHKVGNPNAQLQISIRNTGGRAVRIRAIRLEFRRGVAAEFSLSAKNFFQVPTDNTGILFTPFDLRPDDEWNHIVTFFEYFAREEMRQYRQIESNLRNDIVAKRQMPGNENRIVEADFENV